MPEPRASSSRRVALLCALLIGACAASGVLCAGAAADTPPAGLGINAQELLWDGPSSNWGPQLSLMAYSGIRVVRTDVYWQTVEPNPPTHGVHNYDWGRVDTIVGALASYRLQWLPVADYSTPWATSHTGLFGAPDLLSPPSDPRQFAAFVAAVVQRYGAGGSFWRSHPNLPAVPISAIEIWNEENGFFWHPQPNPGAYAQLYEDARWAAHAVDPKIEVIVGGLVSGATDFLLGMFSAGVRRIDAVALHTYGASVGAGIQDVAATRSLLDSRGDVNVPIDVTEFGWTTSGFVPGVISDSLRAQWLPSEVDQLARSDCGVERVLPYAWSTPERNGLNPEDWYGLFHPTGQPTLTGNAFVQELQQLDQTHSPDRASQVVCSRPLQLALATIISRGHRHRHGHGHHRRHVTRRQSVCVTSSLTSGGSPVSGAWLNLTVLRKRDHEIWRQTLQTADSGQTQGCFALFPGRYTVGAVAGRWDFHNPAGALAALRVRS